MSKKIEISEKFVKKVLENGGVVELKKLIEDLLIDRDFNLKIIKNLEKKLEEKQDECTSN